MKISRKKLKEIINEHIYGSSYHNRPRDPKMYVDPQVRKKIERLTSADNEEDQRMGYQLASTLQQDELVFPNDSSDTYEETPYKGLDYVDDINNFNNKAILRMIGDGGSYLSSSDLNILNSVAGKELNYVLAGWNGAVFYLANDNRSTPYAIKPDDLDNIVIKVAAKKKEITQADIDEHMGMDSEVDARHRIVATIMNIANKTYVSRHDLEDLGIGEENYNRGSSSNFPRFIFAIDPYAALFRKGKLVII